MKHLKQLAVWLALLVIVPAVLAIVAFEWMIEHRKDNPWTK